MSDVERQALAALRKMREQLAAADAARHEPLAIVGAACRLPGAPDIASFWELLSRGGDAISDIPPERWDDAALAQAGAACDARVPRKAGLLSGIDAFDAEFFGISGREAQLMDPQQRIFLEVAWHALESAGIPPLALKGSRTGVFVGTTTTDYLHLLYQRLAGAELDAYIVSGNSINATAGRVSYTLGLQGPAMAIDTACSSSLVAIDRACRSVRDGESRLAIAGGVNLVLTPELLLSLARWGMLAPDGHCKTFDAAADGFVRAEGCGVVLIKRLSDARADGDPIWALLRGWAVNQAGPTSGFSVPNGTAQAAVMRDALAAARIDPASVGYVEAHGTGTSLGDPIEMESINEVYGAGRAAGQALWVGAVKSNVGHLEAAAGVTGLIKTVLALRHRQIPPNLHFHQPTPHIPWDRIPVRVPTRLEEWHADGAPRRAAVSAFGFSGTNAHVVLEEAPALAPQLASAVLPAVLPTLMPAVLPAVLPALMLTLSARSPTALAELALHHAQRFEHDRDAAESMCLAASAGRSHLAQRLAVSALDAPALAARLREAARGAGGAGIARGRVGIDRPGVAFLFTGQGAQYAGMGRHLAETSTVYRDALERCAALIDPLLDRPLLELMWDADPTLLERTGYAQPALFATAYALTQWWRSVGVEPTLVLGHSVGEFAAAVCAGVLSLDDAARLVTTRGALMQALPAGGAMAAVFAPEAAVREQLTAIGGVLAVAGINGPEETVVSGEAGAVQALAQACRARKLRVDGLAVSHAFHSPLMQPMLARFEAATAGLQCAAPQCAIISTLTGRAADADWGSAAYWSRQLQAPVRGHDALRSAAQGGGIGTGMGIGIAIEIGPQPVLAGLGRRALPDAPVAWLPSLRRGQDDAATAMQSLAELYVRGAVDDWSGRAGVAARARAALPAYPFQRQRHWVDAPAERTGPHVAAAPQPDPAGHPLLGTAVPLATGDPVFQAQAGAANQTWLREHRINASSVWPAAASIEMLLAAAVQTDGAAAVCWCDITLRAPLLLPDDAAVTVQTVLRRSDAGEWRAELCRAPGPAGGPWPVFVSARRVAAGVPPAAWFDLQTLQARCPEPVDPAQFYAAQAAAGARFGAAFRSLVLAGRGRGEAYGQARVADGNGAPWHMHPALLDGCLQLVSVAAVPHEGTLWLPAQIERFHWHRAAAGALWCHARLRPQHDDAQVLVADLAVCAEDGAPVATITGARFVRSRADAIAAPAGGLVDRACIEFTWQRLDEVPQAAPGAARWHLVGGNDGVAASLAAALIERGQQATLGPADVSSDAAQVVHLLALDLPAGLDPDAAMARLRPALESAVALVQACATRASTPPRLWFVTRGAHVLRTDDIANPLAAAVWGFARVVRSEHPPLFCTLIDIDAGCTAAQLAQALLTGDERESQLALRNGERFGARLRALPAAHAFRVTAPRSGRIDELRLQAHGAALPRAGEVRIDVQAAGLNFRDVLGALGMVDAPAETIGSECAGIVSAVGAGVTGFAPGDAVFALAPGSLASSVCVAASFVAHRPPGLAVAQAAALPIACLTASYGLEDLAGLRRGDRVLIHAATGGVGMAAVQLAQRLGAEVYASAGSESKRMMLRALGIVHVFDSRSLGFREEILARTGGQGVQVVLNALAGEFIPAGLGVLVPGGCFLEMGKRGIWSAAQVAREFATLRYCPFDLGDAAQHDPSLAPRLFARLLARLQAGELAPLPVRTLPMRELHSAFETMAHARHTGKLVLCRDLAAPALDCAMHADAGYLITGGFGAVGLTIAEALVARGARHLLLLGRHAPSAAAELRLRELEARGAVLQRAQVDVADLDALRAVLAGTTLPPLRGVVHAAGVLDDGVLTALTWPRFDAVLKPKLQGALNLAAATETLPLDFFVLFGAGAAWLGAPGQANYAAANAALDALAQALRQAGRPATAIAWGRWQGAGMAATARADGVAADWAALGVDAIAPADGAAAMFELIGRNACTVGVLPINWPTYLGRLHRGQPPACFDGLLPRAVAAASTGPGALAALQARPAHQRRDALAQLLERLLRKVIGLPPERAVDPAWPLRELGMDSLMTVELRNAIGAEFERNLPATLVFDHPTLAALTEHLWTVLPGLKEAAAAAMPAATDAAAAVRDLSEAEAQAQLLAELGGGAR